MKNRHSRRNRCPHCNAATFTVRRGFTKPEFVCGNGHTWQYGRDGGHFLREAQNFKRGQTALDYVSHHYVNGKLTPTCPAVSGNGQARPANARHGQSA